jgi:hypothetical protein
MTRTIRKAFILLIVTFWIHDLKGQSAIQRDTSKIHPVKPKSVTLIKTGDVSMDSTIRILSLISTCICDPAYRNELGISIIGSLNSPNIGLGLDLKPRYFNRLVADLIFRTDFSHNYIVNSGLEIKYLSRRAPIDIRLEYSRYNLRKTILIDYYKYLAGLIYRVPGSSMGLLIGQDNYQAKNNIGYEIFLKYRFRKAINTYFEPSKPVADIYTGIGYWNNRINYKVKFDYLLNYSMRIGIGYERIYDFNEFILTFEYVVFYF